jgi:sugar phosphate isomerase/epimerase
MNRRRFLHLSALAGAGLAVPDVLGEIRIRHLGVQLWSVRGDMERDPAATLRALAEMGYREVEGFGYRDGKLFGRTVAEFGRLLRDHGLTMPSSHYNFGLEAFDFQSKTLSAAAKRAIDDAARLGQRYIVNAWVEESQRGEIARLIEVFRAAGDYARSAGLRFGYHNHDFEFVRRGPDQRLLMEWLLQDLPERSMRFEMDIYWVHQAGHQALDWIRRYPGRWELCHLKDLAATEQRETIEVGDGTIDFAAILRERRRAGFCHYIVELEHYRTTPLQGVRRARENFLRISRHV